jgi:4-amino-4-deoxy-L-arabinose transferase-like glycosyltransferase
VKPVTATPTPETAGPRRPGVAWLALLLPLLVLGQCHGLWGADEPREAEIARELYASGDWVVPRLNGEPFLEKPPLAHWAAATVFVLTGGASETRVRWPAALWGGLGILAAYWLGRMLFGRQVGLIAAFVLATSLEWLIETHTFLVDTPLAAGVAASLALFWWGYTTGSPARRRLAWALATALIALAFLAKGPIGIVLPAAALTAFAAWRREWRVLGQVLSPLNLALLAALIGPWLVLLAARGGHQALWTLFWHNTVLRALSPQADHAAPPWFYLQAIPAVLLPWSVLLPPVLWAFARPRPVDDDPARSRWQFLVASAAAPLLVLSIASGKREGYLLPLMPVFAVVLAAWLTGALQRAEASWQTVWRRAGTVVIGLVAVAAWGLSLWLATGWGWSRAIAATGLVATLAAAAGAARSQAGGAPCLAGWAAALAWLAASSMLSPATFAAIDGRRGYATLQAALRTHAGPAATVYGYDLGERELGVLGFERRTRIAVLREADGIRRALEKRGDVVVISRVELDRLRSAGAWPGLAEIVAAPAMRSRPYVLVKGARAAH